MQPGSAIHVLVRGRVQGVGFRWCVRERARRWGLAGWVRNRPDGTVELAAYGSDEGVAGLRRDVVEGPPGAAVEAVVDLPTPSGTSEYPEPFTIRRD